MRSDAVRVEWRLYVTDDAGTVWRVHDLVLRAGKRLARRPPYFGADERVFVAEDGAERTYRLKPGEESPLTEEALVRQLAESESGAQGGHR
jgi:hypothetical protein